MRGLEKLDLRYFRFVNLAAIGDDAFSRGERSKSLVASA